jgi:hypothetical protein
MLAVEAGRLKHILPEDMECWTSNVTNDVQVATDDDVKNLTRWKIELEERLRRETRLDDDLSRQDMLQDDGNVMRMEDLVEFEERRRGLDDEREVEDAELEEYITSESLNEEQRRAYDIIEWHLDETLRGRRPPQLRMIIVGEGGTGKSRTIRAITANFERRHVDEILVKGAYTGIAASIIDGRTLHVLTAMPLKGVRSAKTMKKLALYWKNKKYLIIDEMSMLSRQFLAKLSKILTTILCSNEEGDDELPFGGLNVILVGDFHQFPPVVSGRAAPLYYPNDPRLDHMDALIGREIYEQFSIVVQLRRQIRVDDPVWQDLLQHVRYGNCRKDHIDLLRSLIVTNPESPKTDYDSDPWKLAILVTPRHGVRTQWNTAVSKKACAADGTSLLLSPAIDNIEGRSPSLVDRFAILRKAGNEERAGLMKMVELAIGMPVMVTMNVHTELDIANGSRGTITGIVLHPDEKKDEDHECLWKLSHPPLYVLVRLERTKIGHLSGLPPHVVPISPIAKTFNIIVGEMKKTVTRTQLPLTTAHAFTDFRSQGQTIVPVIVDIGRPPTGKLTAFNAYVMLSRAKGRRWIRLLRDFDEQLFQQHPSEYLRMEDERLKILEGETTEWWKIMRSLNRKNLE